MARNKKYVLYVPTVALRTVENPALDVALAVAHSLGLPLIVHAYFDSKGLHATTRRGVFVLDGLREMAQDLTAKGIVFAFQLIGLDGGRSPAYLSLGSQAACIITDEPFVEPYLVTVDKLSRCGPPLVSVDASCILPARLVKSSDTQRAFSFRAQTQSQRLARARKPYPKLNAPVVTRADIQELVGVHVCRLFVDLREHTSSEALLGRADVDASVPAVRNTRGGQSFALARWRTFKAGGLSSYAATRNDPLKHNTGGVSRMSPYLNQGMISPFLVARDVVGVSSGAAAGKGLPKSQEKFFDEFGVWRELAYCFCFYNPNCRQGAKLALPRWAFDTLSRHASDERFKVFTLNELATAQTNEPLWDAAQRSLVKNGQLHNNLRMTWGKQVVKWTRGPEEAYSALLYLNDRFGLDALSPPSLSGVLWCLGWADGKHNQETPIFGWVRPRCCASVSRRYDIPAFLAQVDALEDSPDSGTDATIKEKKSTVMHFFQPKRPKLA